MIKESTVEYIENLELQLGAAFSELMSEVVKYCSPGEVLRGDEDIFKKLKKCGFSEEIINLHFKDGFKAISENALNQNPYYKNISLNSVKENGITVEKIAYLRNEIDIVEHEYMKNGYIQIPIGVYDGRVKTSCLMKNNRPYLSVTPNEIMTKDKYIKNADGDVLIVGLGLGYSSYMMALKNNVNSIVVIEEKEEVINIFTKYILPQFKEVGHKIKVIHANYIEYFLDNNVKELYDYIFVDNYDDIGGGLSTFSTLQEILTDEEGRGVVNYWFEEGIYNAVRRAILQAIILKRIVMLKDNECADMAYKINQGSLVRYRLALKALNYLEDMKVVIEELEDVDLVLYDEKMLRKIAGYKSFKY